MSKKRTLFICFIILLSGGAITVLIFLSEPTAERVGATKETAMLVDVVEVQRGDYRPHIRAMGTVQPAKDIILSPRISGEIIWHAPEFTPGGYVQKGTTLLQIDPADYKNTLEQRKSELQQAEADLMVEMGRQDVAKKDYQLIEDTLSKENKALVLRQPQLEAARSMVKARRAAADQAQLELNRTQIKAPFDAQVLTRNVNVGSQVAPGDNLARLVGLDEYWVIATVPVSKLKWLTFRDEAGHSGASVVKIRDRTAWEEGAYRNGSLFKLIGALEDQTRMARVLITVSDPLGIRQDTSGMPELMVGSFVEATIEAKNLTNVIRISRDYIRQQETVWVMQNNQLEIRQVYILFRDATHAYISGGLEENEKVVTTNLSTVVEGAKLRSGKVNNSMDTTKTGDQ